MLERVSDWNTLGDTPFRLDEQDYLVDLDIDLLKVAHHGSSGSTCSEFLEAVKPEYAVISVGDGNSYNHPNEQALDRIDDYVTDDNLFRTDLNGDIIATITPSQDNTKGILEVEGNKQQNTDSSSNSINFLKLTLIPYDKFKAIAA